MAGGEIASAYLTIYPKLEGKAVANEITRGMSGAGTKAGSSFASSASGQIQSGMGDAGSKGGNALANGLSAAKIAVANVMADIAMSAANEFKSRFSEGIAQSDAMQKFASTMEFAGVSTKNIDRVRDAMKEYADQTVYDLGEVLDTTAKLASNGVSDYESLVQAAGNLNAAAGGNSESFGYFANAITQVNGAGKLMAQDWNQIINALPGASGAIQKELEDMGAWDTSVYNFKEAMSKGKISAEEFNTAIQNLGLTDVAEKAATSTTTFEGAMGQMDAAITNFTQSIYDAINGDGRVTGFINSVAEAFDSLAPTVGEVVGTIADSFAKVVPYITEAAGAFDDFMDGFGSTFEADEFVSAFEHIKSIGAKALDFLTENADEFGAAFGVAADVIGALADAIATVVDVLSPFIPSIVAVVGAIAGFSALAPVIGAFTTLTTVIIPALGMVQSFGGAIALVTTLLGGPIPIIAAVVAAVVGFIATNEDARNAIINAWNAVKEFFAGIPEWWSNVWGMVTARIEVAKKAIELQWNYIKGVAAKTFNNIKTTISNAMNNAKTALTNAVTAMKQGVTAKFNEIVSFVKGIPSKIKSALSGLGNLLLGAGRSIISGLLNGIKEKAQAVFDYVSGIAGKVKSLKGPLPYDLKVLVPNGMALMEGLRKGIEGGFDRLVSPYVSEVADSIGASMSVGGAGYGVHGALPAGGTVYNVYLNDLAVNDDAGIVSATRGYLTELKRLGAI